MKAASSACTPAIKIVKIKIAPEISNKTELVWQSNVVVEILDFFHSQRDIGAMLQINQERFA